MAHPPSVTSVITSGASASNIFDPGPLAGLPAVPASVTSSWRVFAIGFGQGLPYHLNRATVTARRLRRAAR
jgi:hypothetical protein